MFNVTSTVTRVPFNLRSGRPWPRPMSTATEQMDADKLAAYMNLAAEHGTVVARSDRNIQTCNRFDGYDMHLDISATPEVS